MTTITDSAERTAALDAQRSFCVTAPAGSGKTELLIQRYLRLLSRVERPEQILAITFTRKAAAEMRERVYRALEEAEKDSEVTSDHQGVTRRLANEALQAGAQGGWDLLRDLNQFNIKTIDSFCAGLTAQMPVLSQLGGSMRVEDDANLLYREAVNQLFDGIEGPGAYADDLAALLLHFGNDWDRLAQLLVELLGRRQQWQAYVGVHYEPRQSERYLIRTLQTIVEEALAAVAEHLAPYEPQLVDLMHYSATNLGEEPPDGLPDCTTGALEQWRAIAGFLLTEKGQWRSRVTVTQGFPAKGEGAAHKKESMAQLLTDLAQIPGLEVLVAALRQLPTVSAGSASWELVVRLSRLLPMLAAQLLIVFRNRSVLDHAQVAQSALLALGDSDNPTDLALRLDYRIDHILVDEFQDTAVTQFDLLDKLTRGWGEHNAASPESPRTLFIVGDAMQSIYGFRGANVGLLLKAQREGFNGVTLDPLVLSSNFRSQAGIVDWVNTSFAQAFSQDSGAGGGQVSFSPAAAVKPTLDSRAVELHLFAGESALHEETRFICNRIAALLADEPEASIALLGRSRTQLAPLLRALKDAEVPYYAQDLDTLAQSPAVADLLTLCRTLANPADRLAWMALLRSPWCGLELADLLVVAHVATRAQGSGFRYVLEHASREDELSADSRARLERLAAVIAYADRLRDRLGLRVWIEQIWLALNGPAAAANIHALSDVESFMTLLEEADVAGQGLDVDWLEQKLARRYMAGGDVLCPLHVMTIHKAKGLEFDHVFIPQMGRGTRAEGRDLLLWEEYSDNEGNRAFLLAADDREKKAPTLYNFLAARRKEKSRQENTRLMYVAATRAVRTLTLTGCANLKADTLEPKDPASNSLLNTVWTAVASSAQLHETGELKPVEQAAASSGFLARLAPSIEAPQVVGVEPDDLEAENRPEPANNFFERAVGTAVHLALENLSNRSELPETVDKEERELWKVALLELGLFGDDLERAMSAVTESVELSIATGKKGRWLLSSARERAQSEWPIVQVEGEKITQGFIDRTFVDETTGVRWIIDYKSSKPANAEPAEAFMRREAETYRDQLRRYRDAVSAMESRPIRCALYFTALGELHTLHELDMNHPEQERP